MFIKTKLISRKFKAVTIWPFIFIRKEEIFNVPLIAHEMVHYKEQRKAFVIPWLLRYVFSKRFRLEAEVRAYRLQIAQKGISIPAAVQMLREYRTDVTLDEATAMLVSNQ